MIVAWVLFPLVLAVVGLGWGRLIERGAGARVNDALLLPLGLAGALVVAGTLTAFSATARAATPVVAVGAAAGVLASWRAWRLSPWPLLAAAGVLLAYGAPVLLSGHATFTGFVKLDDTATWFNVIDHVMSHARSVSGEPASTYRLLYTGDVGPSYPLSAFMLAGVGRALVGANAAWVFQPYLACCAAALSLCAYALLEPLVASVRVRALLAFFAAQPALLFGYSLWGGIKEMTAAVMLALGVALAAPLLARRPPGARALLPLAVAGAALIQTLGPGAGGWVAPALLLVALAWWWPRRSLAGLRATVVPFAWLAAMAAALLIPIWVVLGSFLANKNGAFNGLFSSGQTEATRMGNLIHPLSAFQLAGIWPVGDFRRIAPTLPSAILIAALLVAAVAGLWVALRRRHFGVALYVAVALVGCGAVYFSGGTPWVTGKALAIASPALLVAALAGAGALWGMRAGSRVAGVAGALLAVVVAGGVAWSNVLAYHDVTLAPRARLGELAHINGLISRERPTFINEYEVYADRHFLRDGAPVAPAEYRTQNLPVRSGALLTKAAAADLDSFGLATLEPFRSLVIRRSPAESRPSSAYHLVWQGHYYELWQRNPASSARVLKHLPLGESNALPYCGQAQGGPFAPLCSIDPVATPPCSEIEGIGREAGREGGVLLAYERPAPIVARGDQTLWPGAWFHDEAGHALTPNRPGEAVGHIAVASAQSYELWLGGSFARGFDVAVDGHHVGRVKDELATINSYVHVADVSLTPGVHTFTLTYPHSDLTAGSGENELTSLSEIALQPRSPAGQLVSVDPTQARQLCGRSLDWIEIVEA
jgi:hypothetical protein